MCKVSLKLMTISRLYEIYWINTTNISHNKIYFKFYMEFHNIVLFIIAKNCCFTVDILERWCNSDFDYILINVLSFKVPLKFSRVHFVEDKEIHLSKSKMKTQLWLRVFSITFLVQVLIITTTSISIQSIKDKIQDDDNLIENESDLTAVDKKETVGEPRWMSSYIFPLFPQFHNLDYNSVWNFLKRSDTIGYFVVRDVISVRKYIQRILYNH